LPPLVLPLSSASSRPSPPTWPRSPLFRFLPPRSSTSALFPYTTLFRSNEVIMAFRTIPLRQRLRSAGGKLLRRYRLLPGGMPDGLGDDEALREATLDGEVVAYFPDTVDSLYQLRSWYGPLQELHRAQGVTIVCMDSRAAAKIRAEVPLPVVTIALDATLDAIILR